MAEKIEQVIGVIGAGPMGAAIARGLVASGAAAPEHVLVANPSAGKLAPLAEIGIKTFTSNDELLAQDPDAVVLAAPRECCLGTRGAHGGLHGRLRFPLRLASRWLLGVCACGISRGARHAHLPVQVLWRDCRLPGLPCHQGGPGPLTGDLLGPGKRRGAARGPA